MDVNIALLTVTDTRTFDNDKSGAILVEKIKEAKHQLIDRKICKDNKGDIVKILKEWTNQKDIDVIITTGGTGLTGRDITPEAVNEIADKHIPGFGEVFRTISLKTVGTSSIQSRALDCIEDVPTVFRLIVLNTSPNPGICLSAISLTASGVISLPVRPVPPVVIITSISF